MRTAAFSLPLLLATPALGQAVAECGTAPSVAELLEPWEETTALLGDGAIRIALLEDEAGQGLLILTLPTIEEVEAAVGEAEPGAPPPIPERRCRIVTEAGAGFALVDVAGLTVSEGTGDAVLIARVPALRFIPESTELEEVTLALTFGLADGSLVAEVKLPEEADSEPPGPDAEPQGEAGSEDAGGAP